MPSKAYQRRQKRKEQYTENSAAEKNSARAYYTMFKADIIRNKLATRNTDKAEAKRHCESIKKKIARDSNYKETNKIRARKTTRRRLADNAEYKERNRKNASRNTHKRLDNDAEYKERNRQAALLNTRRRLDTNENYAEKNREKAANRHKQLSKNHAYREYHRRLSYAKRNDYNAKKQSGRTYSDSDRKRYWLRRSRMLSDLRKRRLELGLQQKMVSESGVSSLTVKMLFRKAKEHVALGLSKLRRMHAYLKEKATSYCKKMTENQPVTEAEFTEAVDGVRYHTASSEPYFWDTGYKSLPADQVVDVDSSGKARIFDQICAKSTQREREVEAVFQRWQCNNLLCNVTPRDMDGVTELMKHVLEVHSSKLVKFYDDLDKCNNAAKTDQLGHPQHCTLHDNCESLLRPVRQLACHYPFLRTLAARLYEQSRTCRLIRAVERARTSGRWSALVSSVRDLVEFLHKNLASGDCSELPAERECTVDEDAVIEQFGVPLNAVTKMRDTYNTTACDVCEQLRGDVQSLTSYEGQKGFTSEKMTNMIELLYQRKTQVEDVEEFCNSILICRYCADRLKANKEVPRSVFNKLVVEETPACIQELNIYETALIKHCLTSVTIVRLGQITNVCRPQNELTAAMKGRIAYLPVDVAANASFVPDNVLNFDSFVILVGGQPTKNRKIWTALVDLRKVHAALMWLHDNNKYYADVPAYTVDDLEAIVTRHMSADQQDHTEKESKALIQKLTEASKSHLYENFSVQPLSGNFPADTMMDYQFSKVQDTAENIFGTDLDVKAYPELFPTGENGMRDVSRATKISTTDFLRSRLLNKNPKFRLNINYIFHSFQVQEVSNMCHSIGHMLRTVSGGRALTAKSLLDKLKSRDGELSGKLFSMMANMRGTTEYFSKLALDIKWMVRHLGPPTLFLTVSIAEWYSEPLLEYIRTINAGKGHDVDNMTAAELCAMDPVSVNIHFHQKWQAIFTKLIKSTTAPVFGEVSDHFWRIEYQSRGAPHCHCLLWVKDAPILGRDSVEDVKAYIDKVITCAKPDKKTSPTLHDMVTRFQTHKCNRYCLKSYKKNGQFYRKCRFGFPRPVRERTEINNVIDCLAVNQSKQPRKRLYHIQRTEEESRINDYNPALLLASQSNIDVQYIGHTGSRLPYYVTSYITKSERCEQDKMWEDIYSASKSLGSNAMSFAMKAVKSRQVGANEAADRLLGHKLFSKSRQMKFADLSPLDQVKRVLKPAKEIELLLEKDPNSDKIFYPHAVLDVYPDRPDELEDMSLHNFLSLYDKVPTGSKDQLQLKTLGYYLRKRTLKPYIVTHKLINPNTSPENENQYYFQLLKMFKPWRTESDFLTLGKSCKEVFMEEKDKYPEMAAYDKQLVNQRQSDAAVDEAIRQKRQETEDVEDEQNAFEGCVVNTVEAAMQDVIDAHRNVTGRDNASADQLTDTYDSLNTDQKRVVDKVVKAVCQNERPCRLIVSGQGGTGKSRVISVIQHKIADIFRHIVLPVVVTAPTGLAAFNIHGTTIHRLLSLPVEHGKPADYHRIQQEQLTFIRAALKDVRLIIIDEISMISSLTLLYIHLRLSEIMDTDEPFGGVSLVCFGDLLQLPPVKGNQPFQPVTAREAKQRLGAISSLSLWEKFEYDELNINMRQNNDAVYANLLSNVRQGQISDDEYAVLETRRISSGKPASMTEVLERYFTLSGQELDPVILMPRTEQCRQVNEAILHQLESHVVELPAIDTLDTVVDKKLLGKIEAAYEKVDKDVTRTAGLDKCLRLCIGAKILLKRNISVESGLVNGSVGVVKGFNTKQVDDRLETTAVNVQFCNTEQSVRIERQSCTFEVLKSIFYTRKQFPLTLAFAITIHKSQGLSLKTAIVDVGQSCFGSGMAYVALSRVTSLAGLHLVDVAREKIVANRSALEEYNRLRNLHIPHLPSFTIPTKKPVKRKTVISSQTATTEVNSDKSAPKTEKRRKMNHHERETSVETTDNNHNNIRNADTTFSYHAIYSVDETFQSDTCHRLNLQLCGTVTPSAMSPSQAAVAQQLHEDIYNHTHTRTNVHVHNISGDGNCLFRALSQAVTGSQSQHSLLRMYITNHMSTPALADKLKRMFLTGDATGYSHIVSMQDDGRWGTHIEIAMSAHLFDCSIVCFSSYANQLNLQHFPPHFIDSTPCQPFCNHPTLYLINSTGTHYECATVRTQSVSIPPLSSQYA